MCPTLVTYSKEFQNKVADDLDKASVEIQRMITDYGQLRQACRSLKD